mgnify:CR=1 FL=1
MLYTATLVLHIITACVSIAALVYTVYALVRGSEAWYKRLSLSIAALASMQVVSGFMLAVLSPTLSVMTVGQHLLLYLGICLLAEMGLVLRMRKVWIG